MGDETSPGASNSVLGLWAYVESIVWFIAADYPLFLRSLTSDDHGVQITWVTAGSLLGIVSHIALLVAFPETTESVLRATPFVQPWMFDDVATMLSASTGYALVQPWTFIAVKVWTYTAVAEGVSLWSYVALVTAGRVTRWAVVAGAARVLRTVEPRLGDEWYWYTVGAWTACFAAVLLVAEV